MKIKRRRKMRSVTRSVPEQGVELPGRQSSADVQAIGDKAGPLPLKYQHIPPPSVKRSYLLGSAGMFVPISPYGSMPAELLADETFFPFPDLEVRRMIVSIGFLVIEPDIESGYLFDLSVGDWSEL